MISLGQLFFVLPCQTSAQPYLLGYKKGMVIKSPYFGSGAGLTTSPITVYDTTKGCGDLL